MSISVIIIIGVVVFIGILVAVGLALIIIGSRKRRDETPQDGHLIEIEDLGEKK